LSPKNVFHLTQKEEIKVSRDEEAGRGGKKAKRGRE
jgi:hypothetical protein